MSAVSYHHGSDHHGSDHHGSELGFIDRHIGPDLDTTCALLQRAARGLSIA